jgi:hypothetical protein
MDNYVFAWVLLFISLLVTITLVQSETALMRNSKFDCDDAFLREWKEVKRILSTSEETPGDRTVITSTP